MKKFLTLMVALIVTLVTLLQTYLIIVRNENLSKIESCDYILLGDSHTEFVKDERIYNFSIPGCSYQLHEKLIKSIPLNKEKVIINVAPHNFGNLKHKRYFSNNPSHINWRTRFFIDLPKSLELFKPYKFPKYSTIKAFKSFGKSSAIKVNQEQDLSKDRLEYTLTKHFGDSTLTDTLEINAFNRIIDFLNESEVEFIVVQMPHHPTYWDRIPPRILSRYNNVIKKRENKISYNGADESHFYDGDHILAIYQGLYLNANILDSVLGKPTNISADGLK